MRYLVPEPRPFRVDVPDDLKNQGRSAALSWTGVRPLSHPEFTDYGESITSIAFVIYQLSKPEEKK